jgi:CRISPR system Cascade subunit CasB
VTFEPAIYGFVRQKIALLDKDTPWSRAMLAKLRRGVGKPPDALPDIWEVTLADMPDEWYGYGGNASFAEWAIHTTLSLYALPRQGKIGSMNVCGKTEDGKELGDSFGGAAARLVEQDASNLDAVKRRFDAVATSVDFKELMHHARGIIQLLKAKDILFNYPCFAKDLYAFQFAGSADKVRLCWGEDFYRVLSRNKNRKEDSEE